MAAEALPNEDDIAKQLMGHQPDACALGLINRRTRIIRAATRVLLGYGKKQAGPPGDAVSREAACQAAILLGEYRAIDSIPALMQHLLLKPSFVDGHQPIVSPTQRALIRIGKPAAAAILKAMPREAAAERLHAYANVLRHIEGDTRAKELINVLIGRVKTRTEKERLQQCLKHIESQRKLIRVPSLLDERQNAADKAKDK